MMESTSSSDISQRFRVAQWCTGNVGARALRRVIEHPDLDLVGVYVNSDAKAGLDAGALCDLPPVGVAAVRSLDAIIATRPDCVLYMPHVMNYDEVCALLEAGINIITTRTEFQNPAVLPAAIRERVETAARRGGASLHGTGSSPGFITEALPPVLFSLQRRLDCLTIYEFADTGHRNSPEMIFETMGFGAAPSAEPNHAILEHFRESFGGSLSLLAAQAGIILDTIEVSGGIATARNDVRIVAGLIPAGTVAATRFTVSGMREGHTVIRFVANWYVSSDVVTDDGEEWLFRDSGWRIVVEGDCPLDVSITFPASYEEYTAMAPGLTANRPVNMVPLVCAARPGILTTFDLPPVTAKLG